MSLSSALNEAKEKKLLLQQKLDSHIQVKAESLHWSNQLDDMREKLESRKLVMGNMSMHVKVVEENVKKEEERLSNEIRSLLVAGTALSVASKRLQVMKLKEQLSEAEKEIQRLLERCDGVSSNSPASLFSMEAMDPPPFLGEFGMEGFGNIFYVPKNNYNHGMDWVNLI